MKFWFSLFTKWSRYWQKKSYPVDLSKLSDVIKNDVVKKAVYDKLDETVNNIDISGFFLRNKYERDKTGLENKFPGTSGLAKKLDYDAKIKYQVSVV